MNRKKKFKFYKRLNYHDNEIYLVINRTIDSVPDLNRVPEYDFDICLIETGEAVGRCSLRVGMNDNLYYGGNIGYSVYNRYRGNRYAMKASLLLFQLAKRHSMERLIITCNPDNIASSRTCDLLGAKYLETVDIPTDNEMYMIGDRKKMIYEVII